MTCLGDLPELVVVNIFSYLHYDASKPLPNLKRRLPLIAVNRSWRNCGLHSLYGTLIFDFRRVESKTYRFNPDTGRQYCSYSYSTEQSSSAGLFHGTKYLGLVSGLKIIRSDSYSCLLKLHKVLRLFTGTLTELESPDVGFASFDSIYSTFSESGFKPTTLEALAFDVARRFYQMFPNIRHFDVAFGGFQNDLNYLVKALVSKISQPLRFFRCESSHGMMYSWYPGVDIRDAVCGSKDFLIADFPGKWRKLESLRIINPTRMFSWQKHNQTDKTTVFPNLRKLTLDCYEDIREGGIPTLAMEHSKLAFPEFPMLWYLKLHISNRQGIEFEPRFIPTRLERVVLSGNALAVVTYGKLPVKSVGYLEIHLSGSLDLLTYEFYQAINRLFTDVEITHSTNVILKNAMIYLDVQRIHWKHIDRLELSDADLFQIYDWLEKLPTLRSLKVAQIYDCFGWSSAEMAAEAPVKISKCWLQILRVDKHYNAGIGNLERVAMCLMRPLKELKYVYVPEHAVSCLHKAMAEEETKYQHFKDIKICSP